MVRQMEIRMTNNKKYVNKIVEIHMQTFRGFFLTFLGRGFLKYLYQGFMEEPESGIIVAIEHHEPIGFIAYSENISNCYKYLIRKHLIAFAWYGFLGFIRNPRILFRLLRAFTYSDNSKRDEEYMELLSIGVLPNDKNQGIGTAMIEKLVSITDFNRLMYIKLETDRDNNEGANYFYQKNGFLLDHHYVTPEGRRMNEYRYYRGDL